MLLPAFMWLSRLLSRFSAFPLMARLNPIPAPEKETHSTTRLSQGQFSHRLAMLTIYGAKVLNQVPSGRGTLRKHGVYLIYAHCLGPKHS